MSSASCLSLQCDYEKAVESFGHCCEICSELDDAEALHEARVQYGIARGHMMMGSFSACISDNSSFGLQSIVGWKDARMALDAITREELETVHDVGIVNSGVSENSKNLRH